MAKRKAEDDEWDLFKDEILSLYAESPLSEVIVVMESRGFKRTYYALNSSLIKHSL
jgi:hypothetical protein